MREPRVVNCLSAPPLVDALITGNEPRLPLARQYHRPSASPNSKDVRRRPDQESNDHARGAFLGKIMRNRDTRTDYTLAAGTEHAVTLDRKRRRRRLVGLVVLAVVGGAAILGYRHFEPALKTYQPLAPLVSPSPKTTRVYRWRDENGHWQVADSHPGKDFGYEVEVLEYRNNVNVLSLPPQIRGPD